MGKLYYGDNLEIMRNHIKDESIDLIYLDPPFNSQSNYNVLFKEKSGELSVSQIKAFSDFWHWDLQSSLTYDELVTSSGIPQSVSRAIKAIVDLLGQNDLSAYLVMMAIRLVEMRRLLKYTGSIYLHCDPTASHYLKIIMDQVFRPENFRNEITWQRTSAHNDPKKYGNIADIILYYTKSENYTWNAQYTQYSEKYVENFFRYKDERGKYSLHDLTGPGRTAGESGKAWRKYDPSIRGRHWAIPSLVRNELRVPDSVGIMEALEIMEQNGRIVWSKNDVPRWKEYLADMPGVPLQNLWTDIPPVSSQSNERLGYPTQKPLALLERIINASSNKGGIVLDPFCGCGTAIHAAQKLGRDWIGIDITHLAINLIRNRIQDAFHISVEVEGEPKDLEGARALKDIDTFQFQWWALSLIGARPVGDERKKGADRGIDGVVYNPKGKGQHYYGIVQVKSGHVKSGDIRDFRGTIEREKADYGIFITLEEPSDPMKAEALEAGFIKNAFGENVRKIQIVTIADLLKGMKPDMPARATVFVEADRESEKKNTAGTNMTLDDLN
jgi:site-specific DNA-methyltransferase (adenine-specific)